LREYGGKGKKREKGKEQRGEREIGVKKDCNYNSIVFLLNKGPYGRQKKGGYNIYPCII